jgi:hypothetical protein
MDRFFFNKTWILWKYFYKTWIFWTGLFIKLWIFWTDFNKTWIFWTDFNKTWIFWADFNKTWIFWTDFYKTLIFWTDKKKHEFSGQIFFFCFLNIKFHENSSSGSQVFPFGKPDGRTEDVTKLIIVFSSFANRSKKKSGLKTSDGPLRYAELMQWQVAALR